MNNFTFYSPTLFAFGRGEAENTGALVRRFGGSRALLVYGGGSVKKNGAYDAVTASLTAAGIPYAELSGVQPNPRSGKVYEGVEIVRREGLDFLLAVGGGSAIDTAKAIGFGALYDGDFWDFFTGKVKIEKTLPVGTVLTISAAGSEGSDSCVITQEKGNLKWGCPKTDVIRPKFSVLDPSFTCSLPAYQTASGAADMIAHICERYFTNTPDVALTDRLAEALIKTVLDAAARALKAPNDYAARAELMWAGMLAHNDSVGIGREQDWASHHLEHELSALYDVTHGAGLAVIAPLWMRHVLKKNPRKLVDFATRVWDVPLDEANPEATALRGIEAFEAFLKSIGMPLSFEEIGARKEDIGQMTDKLFGGRDTEGNYVKLTREDVMEIYESAVRE